MAWASIDNSLFLWRYHCRSSGGGGGSTSGWRSNGNGGSIDAPAFVDEEPLEYSGEEQAICAVGLARPRRGVFAEAVDFLLVVATPAEVALVGVCCNNSSSYSFSSSPHVPPPELALQPLPGYAIPTDGVAFTCIKAAPGGRILAGGADGRLYELLYSSPGGGTGAAAAAAGERTRRGGGGRGGLALAASAWRVARGMFSSPALLSKRDCSGGIGAYLPSFAAALLPSSLTGAPAAPSHSSSALGGGGRLFSSSSSSASSSASSAIIQIAVDAERRAAYLLTASSQIQVFDLGGGEDESESGESGGASASGDGGSSSSFPKKVAEVTDFVAAASRAFGGRELFGYGSYGGGSGISSGRNQQRAESAAGGGGGGSSASAVIHLAVVPPSASERLSLVAVTGDGRRVYFSTTAAAASSRSSFSYSAYPSSTYSPYGGTYGAYVGYAPPPPPPPPSSLGARLRNARRQLQRPTALRAEVARAAPPRPPPSSSSSSSSLSSSSSSSSSAPPATAAAPAAEEERQQQRYHSRQHATGGARPLCASAALVVASSSSSSASASSFGFLGGDGGGAGISGGVLLLAESVGSSGARSRLIAAASNGGGGGGVLGFGGANAAAAGGPPSSSSAAAAALSAGYGGGVISAQQPQQQQLQQLQHTAGLSETSAELEGLLPGDVCAIEEVQRGSFDGDDGGEILHSGDENALSSSSSSSSSFSSAPLPPLPADDLSLPPPRFVVVTTAGVVEVERRRPIDVLAEILAEPGPRQQQQQQEQQKASLASPPLPPPLLDAFIAAHGAAETAALCLSLVVAPPPGVGTAARNTARAALLSPRLGFRSLGAGGGGAGNEAGSQLLSPQQEFLLMQQQQQQLLLQQQQQQQAWDRPLSATTTPGSFQEQQQQIPPPRPHAAAPFAPAPGAAAAYHPLPHPNFNMGGAVALAAASEPDWSPAHRGLCALVVRELGRAWDARIVPVPVAAAAGAAAASSPSSFSSGGRAATEARRHLTQESVRVLEGKLRSLAAFLRSSSASPSFPSSAAVSASEAGRARGGGTGRSHFLQQQQFLQQHSQQFLPPAAKRARLEAAAREDEAAATAAVARLAQRAAEGLFLLRLLLEAGLPRLCAEAGGEEQRQRGSSGPSSSPSSLVSRMELRDWVASKEGDAIAASLLSALIGENLGKGAGGSGMSKAVVAPATANAPLSLLPSSSPNDDDDDDGGLASALAAGCPSYFRPAERAYFRAAAALRAAGDPALPPRDRDERVRAAAALLATAADPLSLDLARLVPQLCRLRAWDACVDLCAAKAAALDPQRVAERRGGGGGGGGGGGVGRGAVLGGTRGGGGGSEAAAAAATAATAAAAAAAAAASASAAEAARQAREELAYGPLAELLSCLLERKREGKAAATNPFSEAAASLPSPEERAAAKRALLSRAVSRCSSTDPLMVEALLAVLVEGRDVEILLLCDKLGSGNGSGNGKGGGGGSRLVEAFLRVAGGLPPLPPPPPLEGTMMMLLPSSSNAAAAAPDPLFCPPAVSSGGAAFRSRGAGTAAIGPLSPSNVAAAELLARVFVARGRPAAAGAVFEALAGRLSSPSPTSSSSNASPSSSSSFVSLAERAEMYQCALLQLSAGGGGVGNGFGDMGSSGDGTSLVDAAAAADRVGVKLALVGIQARAAEALRRRPRRPPADSAAPLPAGLEPLESVSDLASLPAREAADALERSLWPLPLSLSELYNDVAVPHALWGLAIELAALAKHFRGDEPYLGQLWYVYLRDAWENKKEEEDDDGEGERNGSGGRTSSVTPSLSDDADADARRASLAKAVLDVSTRLPPGDPALPLPRVTLRLCGAAAGEWPQKGLPPAREERPRRRNENGGGGDENAAPPAPPSFAGESPSSSSFSVSTKEVTCTLLSVARGSTAAVLDALGALLAESSHSRARAGEIENAENDDGSSSSPKTRVALLSCLADVLSVRADRISPVNTAPGSPAAAGSLESLVSSSPLLRGGGGVPSSAAAARREASAAAAAARRGSSEARALVGVGAAATEVASRLEALGARLEAAVAGLRREFSHHLH